MMLKLLPQLLIERKTIRDLVDSIEGGRYESQKFRMEEVKAFTHKIYLLEGGTREINELASNRRKAFFTARTNTEIRAKYQTIECGSTEKTIVSIARFTNLLAKKFSDPVFGASIPRPGDKEYETYADLERKSRSQRAQMSAKTVTQHLLIGIPNVTYPTVSKSQKYIRQSGH
eukprot:TRINITY_DN8984_c0_g1_i1.p1 TRINITY_DN8984_c0_g1~~TRINITY_DN8984_c0_g1_i1.p1  ORF type:complete len:173 (+),score=27.93 TRINITY_DN8984_c0_g1_i1:170-688(+)